MRGLCRAKKLKVRGNRSELMLRLTITTQKRKEKNNIELASKQKWVTIEILSKEPSFSHSADEDYCPQKSDDKSIEEKDINKIAREEDVDSEIGKFVLIEEDKILKMKMDDMRVELRKRALPVSGKKAEL